VLDQSWVFLTTRPQGELVTTPLFRRTDPTMQPRQQVRIHTQIKGEMPRNMGAAAITPSIRHLYGPERHVRRQVLLPLA